MGMKQRPRSRRVRLDFTGVNRNGPSNEVRHVRRAKLAGGEGGPLQVQLRVTHRVVGSGLTSPDLGRLAVSHSPPVSRGRPLGKIFFSQASVLTDGSRAETGLNVLHGSAVPHDPPDGALVHQPALTNPHLPRRRLVLAGHGMGHLAVSTGRNHSTRMHGRAGLVAPDNLGLRWLQPQPLLRHRHGQLGHLEGSLGHFGQGRLWPTGELADAARFLLITDRGTRLGPIDTHAFCRGAGAVLRASAERRRWWALIFLPLASRRRRAEAVRGALVRRRSVRRTRSVMGVLVCRRQSRRCGLVPLPGRRTHGAVGPEIKDLMRAKR